MIRFKLTKNFEVLTLLIEFVRIVFAPTDSGVESLLHLFLLLFGSLPNAQESKMLASELIAEIRWVAVVLE